MTFIHDLISQLNCVCAFVCADECGFGAHMEVRRILGVLVYHSPCYSIEIGSLSESGARLGTVCTSVPPACSPTALRSWVTPAFYVGAGFSFNSLCYASALLFLPLS